MVIDNVVDAWEFWVKYGGRVGFGVRKQYIDRRKDGSNLVTSFRFVCCKEGLRRPDKRNYKTVNPRAETITNYDARIGLKNKDGKLVVHDFVEEHNHILQLQETTNMLSSQRKVSEFQSYQIELADNVGLQQRKSFDLMSKEVGGRTNLGYIRFDRKNYLRKRWQRSLVHEEVGYLLQYFLSDFKKCMYGYTSEGQFEEGWNTLLERYDVKENTWLQRVYKFKEKCASCYNNAFTLGMRSTQLSESVNADIKSFMNVDLDIIKFFKLLEEVVDEKRYKELRCEYEARQKVSRLKDPYSDMLQQLSEIYTPSIFDLFQHEYELLPRFF